MPRKNKALRYALWMISQGYLSIDEHGHIWRHAIKIGYERWKFLASPRRAENVGGKGYLRLTLQIDGKLQSIMAHRVIWAATGKALQPEQQINHKDLKKQHNHPDNLELTDGTGNMQHAYAHGRTKPYALTPFWRGTRKKLTQDQIFEAQTMRKHKRFFKDIAAHLGISITSAKRITKNAS